MAVDILARAMASGKGGGSSTLGLKVDSATDEISLTKSGEPIPGSGAALPEYGLDYDTATGGLTLTKNGAGIPGETVALPPYGSPLKADSIAGMTDTDKVYVLTTDGHWYYYNGSAWTDGGVYNAVEVVTDKTLTVEDMPADAKAAGDGLHDLQEMLKSAGVLPEAPYWENGRIATNGTNSSNGVDLKSIRSGFIKADNAKVLRVLAPVLPDGDDGLTVNIAEYSTPSITTAAFLSPLLSMKTWEDGITKTFTLKSDTQYIRICIRPAINGAYTDAAAITPAWHSNVYVMYDDGSIPQAWKSGIDKTLTESDRIADAKATGDAIAKCFQAHSTLESGADLDTMLSEGHWFLSGSRTYTNSPLAVAKAGTLEVLRHNSLFTFQRVTSYNDEKVWTRTSRDGSFSGIEWVPQFPSVKIAYFGDSIARGIINPDPDSDGSANNTDNIPNGIARELNCTCENFGIGSIGWCDEGSADKGIAYQYLKRWTMDDPNWTNYYGNYVPGTSYPGEKFIGKGHIDDFDTVVLAFGANDNKNYNLGTVSALSTYDALGDDQFDPDNLTDLTILVQMYRCVRYLKKKKSALNIIIVAPFVAGASRPNGDYDTTYQDHTKRSIIEAYQAFAEKYGCGFISTYDAPIDRFHLSEVLTRSVHPTVPVYHALGKYMAGKVSALAL